MDKECLICNSDIEYLSHDELMECVICHKKESSKARCVKGHFVCNECHMKGVNSILDICLNEESANPLHIID